MGTSLSLRVPKRRARLPYYPSYHYLPNHFPSLSRLRGFGGAFGSRFGYNGLQSVFSGLDDTDSSARKKYPFELEKAIHNVVFIQHHMQRQDQFNAVSIPSSIIESYQNVVLTEHETLKRSSSWGVKSKGIENLTAMTDAEETRVSLKI